jgi:hypothetical protein
MLMAQSVAPKSWETDENLFPGLPKGRSRASHSVITTNRDDIILTDRLCANHETFPFTGKRLSSQIDLCTFVETRFLNPMLRVPTDIASFR